MSNQRPGCGGAARDSGPNPLVAPPGAVKAEEGSLLSVGTKATLTRFSLRQGMGGLFGASEKQPTSGANKTAIHLLSFTLIPPTVSFSPLRLLRHKTTNGGERANRAGT